MVKGSRYLCAMSHTVVRHILSYYTLQPHRFNVGVMSTPKTYISKSENSTAAGWLVYLLRDLLCCLVSTDVGGLAQKV